MTTWIYVCLDVLLRSRTWGHSTLHCYIWQCYSQDPLPRAFQSSPTSNHSLLCPVMKGLSLGRVPGSFVLSPFLCLEMAALKSLPPALLDYRLAGLIMSDYFKSPLYLAPPLILCRMRGTYGPITYPWSSWRHYPQPNPQGLCIHLSTNGIYFWPWPQQQHQGLHLQAHG